MARLTRLAKVERNVEAFCAVSERIAVRLFLTWLVLVGLWTLAKHLL